MTPLDCAARILENPENASPLYDLLVFASAGSGPQHEAEMDHIQATIYAKTEDCERHREAYEKSRLLQSVTSDS